MTDTIEELAKFAAILDEFAAAQRRLGLDEVKKQRLMVARHVGDMNVTFEAVVDEGTGVGEIFAILAPLDGAIDRLKAKADLSDHYVRIANACNAIESATEKLVSMRDEYRQKNEDANTHGRRTPRILNAAQSAALEGQANSIKDMFKQIAAHQQAAGECRAILDGADPFLMLDEQINRRLAALRPGALHAVA
jgi:hypothetical protein